MKFIAETKGDGIMSWIEVRVESLSVFDMTEAIRLFQSLRDTEKKNSAKIVDSA